MSFPSLIIPKPIEILIFRTFIAKFSIWAYISLKIGYFELGHNYDITVTSYLEYWYLFWYVWKEETPSYTMVPITCHDHDVPGVISKLAHRCSQPCFSDV